MGNCIPCTKRGGRRRRGPRRGKKNRSGSGRDSESTPANYVQAVLNAAPNSPIKTQRYVSREEARMEQALNRPGQEEANHCDSQLASIINVIAVDNKAKTEAENKAVFEKKKANRRSKLPQPTKSKAAPKKTTLGQPTNCPASAEVSYTKEEDNLMKDIMMTAKMEAANARREKLLERRSKKAKRMATKEAPEEKAAPSCSDASGSVLAVKAAPTTSVATGAVIVVKPAPSFSVATGAVQAVKAAPSTSIATGAVLALKAAPSTSVATGAVIVVKPAPSFSVATGSVLAVKAAPSTSVTTGAVLAVKAVPSTSAATGSVLAVKAAPSTSAATGAVLAVKAAPSTNVTTGAVRAVKAAPSTSVTTGAALAVKAAPSASAATGAVQAVKTKKSQTAASYTRDDEDLLQYINDACEAIERREAVEREREKARSTPGACARDQGPTLSASILEVLDEIMDNEEDMEEAPVTASLSAEEDDLIAEILENFGEGNARSNKGSRRGRAGEG